MDMMVRDIMTTTQLIFICAFLVAVAAIYPIVWLYGYLFSKSFFDRWAEDISNAEVQELEDVDVPNTYGFARYWGNRLRAEMNYPNRVTTANRQIACNRLNAMWSDEMPDLRQADKLRYRPTIVAMAFIPSKYEVEGAQLLSSAAGKSLRRVCALEENF